MRDILYSYVKVTGKRGGERLQAPDRRLLTMKPGTMWLPGLARVREERGLSIRELADEAGVSPDTVWRLETLRRAAEPKTRRKIAEALGTTIRELRRIEEDARE